MSVLSANGGDVICEATRKNEVDDSLIQRGGGLNCEGVRATKNDDAAGKALASPLKLLHWFCVL